MVLMLPSTQAIKKNIVFSSITQARLWLLLTQTPFALYQPSKQFPLSNLSGETSLTKLSTERGDKEKEIWKVGSASVLPPLSFQFLSLPFLFHVFLISFLSYIQILYTIENRNNRRTQKTHQYRLSEYF